MRSKHKIASAFQSSQQEWSLAFPLQLRPRLRHISCLQTGKLLRTFCNRSIGIATHTANDSLLPAQSSGTTRALLLLDSDRRRRGRDEIEAS